MSENTEKEKKQPEPRASMFAAFLIGIGLTLLMVLQFYLLTYAVTAMLSIQFFSNTGVVLNTSTALSDVPAVSFFTLMCQWFFPSMVIVILVGITEFFAIKKLMTKIVRCFKLVIGKKEKGAAAK